MANAPFYLNAAGSRIGRDLLDVLASIQANFARADAIRAAMIEQTDKPAGTLTVRSDNTSGQVTLAAGHGVVTGILADITWNAGANRRTGVLVGNVNGNNVAFSGGAGDNLPAQDTAIVCQHYTTVANVFKFNVGDGVTISPAIAHKAFNELASFIASAGPSLLQCGARFKQ